MMIRSTLYGALMVVLSAGAVSAEEPAAKGQGGKGKGKGKEADMMAMMAAMEKAGTPGEQHKMLLRRAGKWDVVVKHFPPGQPPMESKGTAETKAMFGDRFVQTTFTGSFMDKPFHGLGLTGYDNVKKKVVGTWVDSMSTGIMRSEGSFDSAGKTITSTTIAMDPKTGKECKNRVVERWESDDKIVEEFFEKKGAKETKMMEIVYTRGGK